jgi:hypothetical protein
MPVSEATASSGMAAFAARGGSRSSNIGTGSPSRAWTGPKGQLPRPTMSATPWVDKKAIAAYSRRSRLRRTALAQM